MGMREQVFHALSLQLHCPIYFWKTFPSVPVVPCAFLFRAMQGTHRRMPSTRPGGKVTDPAQQVLLITYYSRTQSHSLLRTSRCCLPDESASNLLGPHNVIVIFQDYSWRRSNYDRRKPKKKKKKLFFKRVFDAPITLSARKERFHLKYYLSLAH